MKKKINLELIKYISLTILNYVAGSVCRRGLAGEGDEEVSGRYSIAGSASGGGLARGVAEARLSLRSVCFTENRRSRQRHYHLFQCKREKDDNEPSSAALPLSVTCLK